MVPMMDEDSYDREELLLVKILDQIRKILHNNPKGVTCKQVFCLITNQPIAKQLNITYEKTKELLEAMPAVKSE